MPDITLECQDCKQDFLWDEGEQQFFKEKGYQEPKRCRDCRRKKREQKASGGGGGRERR